METVRVPFNQLIVSSERIRSEFVAAVDRLVAAGGPYVLSPAVVDFESAWAAAAGTRYAVGVSNGADALYLALLAAGVGPGDEVIVQGNAYNATVTAILRCGAAVRFVDIHPETLTLQVAALDAALSEKTRAIVPVHLYGQMNDMTAISNFATRHGLAVIEDCAQAHGATWAGRNAGTYSQAAAFSFYPTKNLGAFGEAGAVVTDSEAIFEEVRSRRHLGQATRDDHRYEGWNMRLDVIQAIALRLQLPYLERDISERRRLAENYDVLLERAGWPVRPVVRLPQAGHVYHLYVVQVPLGQREKVRSALADRGVETGVHYPMPVYRQPFYRGEVPDCPVADEMAGRVLSLPLYLGLTREQQEYVCEQLVQSVRELRQQRVQT